MQYLLRKCVYLWMRGICISSPTEEKGKSICICGYYPPPKKKANLFAYMYIIPHRRERQSICIYMYIIPQRRRRQIYLHKYISDIIPHQKTWEIFLHICILSPTDEKGKYFCIYYPNQCWH